MICAPCSFHCRGEILTSCRLEIQIDSVSAHIRTSKLGSRLNIYNLPHLWAKLWNRRESRPLGGNPRREGIFEFQTLQKTAGEAQSPFYKNAWKIIKNNNEKWICREKKDTVFNHLEYIFLCFTDLWCTILFISLWNVLHAFSQE